MFWSSELVFFPLLSSHTSKHLQTSISPEVAAEIRDNVGVEAIPECADLLLNGSDVIPCRNEPGKTERLLPLTLTNETGFESRIPQLQPISDWTSLFSPATDSLPVLPSLLIFSTLHNIQQTMPPVPTEPDRILTLSPLHTRSHYNGGGFGSL